MENNQSTQQQSSELSYSKLHRSSRRKTPLSNNLNTLLLLLNRSSWLIWGGMWLLLLALSAIAILSLIHPINLKQEEPEPKTVATEKPPETSSQTSSSIHLWLVGAAALTFAAGSLVIFKRLNSSSQSPKLRKRSSERALTRRKQRKIMLQGHSSPPTSLKPLSPTAPMAAEIEPVVMLPPEESHSLDSGEESLAEMLDSCPPFAASENLTADNCLNAESEPVVTVLPPEESHLLDSEEESLAEIMDIRKHRSLSSILRGL